ncbi:(S)-8-oxocitronellyl enol synthase CYC2-like [Rutidosis leptorrhynchoides]|uniref:(S)-8-oxocitronellyl enol synthase CYC2-like n=1 Tax=Rutidosis leptorrhynchoides TaxID=125765 RepID=UPI003A98D445
MAVEKLHKRMKKTPKDVAIIFGVTGLVGKQLLEKLLSRSKWKVYGVARRPDTVMKMKSHTKNPNYQFISCNLLDPFETQMKISHLDDVTHVFWVTWASQFPLDSVECYEQNRAMMSNALDSILQRARGLKHFSLQTGTKHYVSLNGDTSFDHLVNSVSYYDENCPRVEIGCNFYYGLEDLLTERLAGAVPWSVHRPGLIIGSSQKTLYNFMGSLCVYGSICKYLNLPFVFGGRKECWEEQFVDVSDARLVAKQQIWAATNELVQSNNGQAFNSINGNGSTWKDIWGAIGEKFGAVVPWEMLSEDFTFSGFMSDKGSVWKEIVRKEGLVDTEMEDLANWYFLDALFRCPVKMLGTREKADRLGFTERYYALDSISYWIDVMRKEKLIP